MFKASFLWSRSKAPLKNSLFVDGAASPPSCMDGAHCSITDNNSSTYTLMSSMGGKPQQKPQEQFFFKWIPFFLFWLNSHLRWKKLHFLTWFEPKGICDGSVRGLRHCAQQRMPSISSAAADSLISSLCLCQLYFLSQFTWFII